VSRKITRRHLLTASLQASAGALIASLTCRADRLPLNQDSSKQTFDVIVIGAGVAGLAAARRLRRDRASVVILEGRNRIGGRIWTDTSMSGVALDLGASWIQGTKGNPITSLARDFNLRTSPTNFDNVALYSAGRRLSDLDAQRIEKSYRNLIQRVERSRAALQTKGRGDISLQAGIDQVLAQQPLSEQERAELRFAIHAEIEDEYAADTADLSLFSWDQDDGFGGENVLFAGGYGQIAAGLARGQDIRLNARVRRVEYGDRGVSVETDQQTFRAERVIVTLPLGVLKRGAITFAPALPEPKRLSIGRLGMGILNKTYLRFPQVFWPTETDVIGVISRDRAEWGEWINFYKHIAQPILLGFNSGQDARLIEGLSNQSVVLRAMKVLRDAFGSSIPDPVGAVVTRWQSDPFSLGSYSSIPPGATGKDYDTLAAPIGDRVFFAGEATSRAYPATVHGAFLSGEREAKRISSL